ncbi:MerR family transcriptional regulator [Streptomyces scabiei]|uniref:MerR family transcriptional regulator n=1 Tax=Streptomyces scabiei TaxID=1930 RepID=UPI001FF3FEA6|nr:MerR family transcriptional regulator [Streptomyces sp. LBUM 1482]
MRTDDGSRPTWSIGAVARQVGLPVKVIRHWSDRGVVAPVGRTAGGYRRYDTSAVARLHLARTLRDLGLGLGEIRAALDRGDGLAEVAAAHADALETQIRRLRARQAVLRTVTRRTTAEGLARMTRTAHMSPDERHRLVHGFLTETLGDLDVPHFREGLLSAGADLPDRPSDEQAEAWLELGELVADGELGRAVRRVAEYSARHARGLRTPPWPRRCVPSPTPGPGASARRCGPARQRTPPLPTRSSPTSSPPGCPAARTRTPP